VPYINGDAIIPARPRDFHRNQQTINRAFTLAVAFAFRKAVRYHRLILHQRVKIGRPARSGYEGYPILRWLEKMRPRLQRLRDFFGAACGVLLSANPVPRQSNAPDFH
jgi:hypothetical protein